jgi:hypothetical protein
MRPRKQVSFVVGMTTLEISLSVYYCIHLHPPPSCDVNQSKALVASEVYHVVITISIFVNRMDRRLEGNKNEGRSIATRGKWGGCHSHEFFRRPLHSFVFQSLLEGLILRLLHMEKKFLLHAILVQSLFHKRSAVDHIRSQLNTDYKFNTLLRLR